MLNLTHRFKIPPQHESRPLQQMARQLDMPYIRRVILRVDIIMLQNALRIEVVNKPAVPEMLVDFPGLFFIYLGRDI